MKKAKKSRKISSKVRTHKVYSKTINRSFFSKVLSGLTVFNMVLVPFLTLTIGLSLMPSVTALVATGETIRPVADYAVSLSPSAGANWQVSTDNSDSSYVQTNGSSRSDWLTDLYEMGNLTHTGVIIDQIIVYIRIGSSNGNGNQDSARIELETNSATYHGTAFTETNAWVTKSQILTTNPITGFAWTENEINNLKAGISLRSSKSENAKQSGSSDVWIFVDYTIDNTAPVLTVPADITTEATGPAGVLVDFSADVTATDNLDSAPVVACVPAAGSTFDLGSTAVSCSATDAAGNVDTDSFNVVVQDTTQPTTTLNGSDPMDVQVGGTYSEPGAVVSDNYDTALTATISGEVDTNTVGSYTVFYDAADNQGNLATQVTRTVNVVDQEAPSTSDNVPGGWQTAATTVTLNCTDNVGCVKVFYTTDGNDPTGDSSSVDAGSGWQFTIDVDGQYAIKYFGVDAAENFEAIKTADNQLQIDATNPTVPAPTFPDSPLDNSEINFNPTFSWDASSEDGSGIQYYTLEIFRSSSTGEPWTSVFTEGLNSSAVSLIDGTYYWHLSAKDNAGNDSGWSELKMFIKDSAAPEISSVDAPLADSLHNSPIAISGVATDATARDPEPATIKYVHLYHQLGDVHATEIDTNPVLEGIQPLENINSDEPYNFSFDWTPESEGTYALSVQTEDKAGNWSGTTYADNVTYDTTAPAKPLAKPRGGDFDSAGAEAMLDFSELEDGLDSIYYTLDGTNPTTVSTKYVLETKIEIRASLTLKAVATDQAGNVSEVMTEVYGVAPVISNEATSETAATSFIATWTTDDPATSRVIYDTVAHEGLGEAPNYGYVNSTAEDGVKVTSHSVTVTGLTAATTYYYRVVSHGSPETVSGEFSITTTAAAATTPSGGGGGGYSPVGLDISQTNALGDEVGETSVKITWLTNHDATSRVVFDTVAHSAVGEAPNYGYAFSTIEKDTDPKVTFHSVTINGLTAGTTYYFRPISHGSPEIFGQEGSFTTKGTAGAALPTEQVTPTPAPTEQTGAVAGEQTNTAGFNPSSNENVAVLEEQVPAEVLGEADVNANTEGSVAGDETENTDNGNAAKETGNSFFKWLLIIIVVVGIVVTFLLTNKKIRK